MCNHAPLSLLWLVRDMEQPKADSLVVRSDLTIKVIVNDPLYQPLVHRYFDHLINNLRDALRNINFAEITNVDPQVYRT